VNLKQGKHQFYGKTGFARLESESDENGPFFNSGKLSSFKRAGKPGSRNAS